MQRNLTPVLAAVIGTGIAVAGYATLAHPTAAAADTTPAASPAEPALAAPGGGAGLPDFSAIVQRAGPSVVNVSTTGTSPVGGGSPFGQIDPTDPFWQFFRRFGGPQQQGEVPTRGVGSGFVVGADGLILTNAHVVDGASEIQVKLTDRREFPAKVVGVDRATDVALLRIAATGLPAVRLGDPARTRVGEWVLAIGSPFGFENSATAGIVSARARSLPNEGYVPFLQTDVAVNPGNSGGPLFNLAGEVIGINSQIYSRSGGYMGLSFAIPIDVAMHVESQLLAHGKVVRGRVGVSVQDVDQALAESFGLPRPEGALVGSVEKGSPAATAGVEPGDVILSLDGMAIGSSNELPPRVAELAPGTRARLEVWRHGARRELEVKVGQASETEVASAEGPAGQGRLGLTVRPLTPDEQARDEVKGGVLVEGVSGAAAKAGIQPGDVLLSVSGTPVSGVDQLRGLLDHSGKHLALLVQRGEARLFVPVTLG